MRFTGGKLADWGRIIKVGFKEITTEPEHSLIIYVFPYIRKKER